MQNKRVKTTCHVDNSTKKDKKTYILMQPKSIFLED